MDILWQLRTGAYPKNIYNKTESEAYPGPYQISNIKRFMKIVKGINYLLTISAILHHLYSIEVWQSSRYTSANIR